MDYLREAREFLSDAKPAAAQAAALIAICERLDKLVEQLTPIQAELGEIGEGELSSPFPPFCGACAEGNVELGPQHTVDCDKYVPF